MPYVMNPDTQEILEIPEGTPPPAGTIAGSEAGVYTPPAEAPPPEPVPTQTGYIQNPETGQIVEVVQDAKIPEGTTYTKGTNTTTTAGPAIPVATQGEIAAGQKILDQMVEEGKKKIAEEKRIKAEAEANWKPDFTKPDPYEGAPESYIKKVKESFKPTVDNPLPPFTGQVVDPVKGLILNDVGEVITFEEYEKQLPTINARATAYSETLMAKDNVRLPDGWMPKDTFNTLPEEYQNIAKKEGYGALQKKIEADIKAQEEATNKLVPYEVMTPLPKGVEGPPTPVGTDIAKYLRNHPGDTATLRTAGFSQEDIEDAIKYNNQPLSLSQFKTQYFKDKNLDVKLPDFNDPDYDKKMDAVLKANDDATEAWKAKYGKSEKDIVKEAGIQVAEMVVPGVYVARNWNKMSGGEKALNIVLDALSFVPVVGGSVKAAATGAKTVGTAGRVARLSAAGKAVGKEIVSQAVAEVRAPIDILIDPLAPIESGIKSVREIGENLLHPRKIPEAVITTSNGTVRLRVSETTGAKEAKEIRDTMMTLAAKGEKPVVEVNGVQYELSRSPLMKETGGGLAHATPMGEAFETGLTVTTKPGMPTAEQGLFVANEPLPKFTETSAFGKAGEKPYIYIVSPETAKKAISSEKVYRGTTEMELKFPVGTKLPPPKQTLFTRIGPEGTVVKIGLEKPLTLKQIYKLKALSLIEDIKQPFKPAITISGGKTLTAKEADDLVDVLKASDRSRDIANTLAKTNRALSPRIEGVQRLTDTVPVRAAPTQDFTRTLPDRKSYTDGSVTQRKRGKADKISERDSLTVAERTNSKDTRAVNRTPKSDRKAISGRASAETDRTGVSDVSRTIQDSDITRTTPGREDRPADTVTRVPPPAVRRPTDDRVSTPPPARPPRTPPPERPPESHGRPPNKYDNMTDKQKRRMIDEASGDAIAWRQGELNGKDVWHVIVTPFEQDNYLTILGRKPGRATLVRGPYSAVKTAQLLYGKELSKPLTVDIGAFDAHLEPITGNKGVALSFKPDPHLSTTSDITISKKPGNISNNGKTFPLRDKK